MRPRTLGAVATGLVLVAMTWMTLHGLLFYRPLPTIDGYYRFLGLDERAEVVRDAFGIPRIEAGTLHDLFFLQGYVTAQDRFAQMEQMRVAAARSDLDIANWPVPNASVRDPLAAYAAGVTKWIEQHVAVRALPAEVALSGRQPERWTEADTLRIIARYRAPRSTRCLAAGAERTAHGAPLFAAELIADASPPGLYEVGLSGPGVRAIGLALPGVPGIVAGHNGRVAWSLSIADEVTPVTVLTAASVADLEIGPADCAADSGGEVIGVATDSAGSDVEAMRLLLGATGSRPAGARIVIDLGDLYASKSALSTGQSGHPAAFHYQDQAQLWTTGQLHRLAWTRDAVARTEGRLVLRPR